MDIIDKMCRPNLFSINTILLILYIFKTVFSNATKLFSLQ